MRCFDSTQLASNQLRLEYCSPASPAPHFTFPLTQDPLAKTTHISPSALPGLSVVGAFVPSLPSAGLWSPRSPIDCLYFAIYLPQNVVSREPPCLKCLLTPIFLIPFPSNYVLFFLHSTHYYLKILHIYFFFSLSPSEYKLHEHWAVVSLI